MDTTNNANENTHASDSFAENKRTQQQGIRRPFFRPMRRPKQCVFCVDTSKKINLKDPSKLYRFVSDRSKILSRRVTGLCAYHQRKVAQNIKVARFLSLIR